MTPKVVLISSDEQRFPVDVDVAAKSVLLKHMISDLNPGGLDDDFEVPVPNVKSGVLAKVLEWCEHYRSEDTNWYDDEDEETRRAIPVPEWDKDFLDVPEEALYEIISAANYLNIKQLLEVGCKTVAERIKFKSPEELRRIFSVQ